VAIGANAAPTTQPPNQININATGAIFNGAFANAFYVNPIRQRNTGAGVGVMSYEQLTGEITWSVN